jgi:hypothetical protein
MLINLAPSVLTVVVVALLLVIGGCVVVIRGLVFPDVGMPIPIAIIGACLVLIGSMFWWRGADGEPQTIEARAIELTLRAAAPGSAFACLDVIANADVEQACESALFATPEAVARAVAYVDARVSVLAASAPLAARDPHYRSSFDRARRALESDRYGFVAHVLRTRGCEAETCAELKLLSNAEHVVANMKAQTFESRVNAAARAWPSNPLSAAASSSGLSAAAPANELSAAAPPSGLSAAVPANELSTAAPPSGLSSAAPPSEVSTATPSGGLSAAAPSNAIWPAVPSKPNTRAPALSPSAVVGAAHGVPIQSRADAPSASAFPAPIIPSTEAPTAEGQRVNRPTPPKRAQSQSTRRSNAREAPPREPLQLQEPTSVSPPPPPASQTVATPPPDGERH